ncbi:MAG: hypothetical protein LBW85_03300 [Deltaproteobacteria bacterium]|jgi:hypothetical protein|nr:hypothetical protein [Deltaproteobacteria bacterium]
MTEAMIAAATFTLAETFRFLADHWAAQAALALLWAGAWLAPAAPLRAEEPPGAREGRPECLNGETMKVPDGLLPGAGKADGGRDGGQAPALGPFTGGPADKWPPEGEVPPSPYSLDLTFPEWEFPSAGPFMDRLLRHANDCLREQDFGEAESAWEEARLRLAPPAGPGGRRAAAALSRVARLKMLRHDYQGALEDSLAAGEEFQACAARPRGGRGKRRSASRPFGAPAAASGPFPGGGRLSPEPSMGAGMRALAPLPAAREPRPRDEESLFAEETALWCTFELAPAAATLSQFTGLCRHSEDSKDGGWRPLRRAEGRLAAFCLLNGHYHAAEITYGRILSQDLDRHGRWHPDSVASMEGLAAAVGFTGDHARSVSLSLDAAAILAEVLGPAHPDTLGARRRAAESRILAGDPAGCVAGLASALADVKASAGPETFEAFSLQGAIGAALLCLGPRRAREALASLSAARDGLSRVAGPQDRETLAVGINLAVALLRAGDRLGALAELKASSRGLTGLLGKSHPEAQLARGMFAALKRELKSASGAKTADQKAAENQVRG